MTRIYIFLAILGLALPALAQNDLPGGEAKSCSSVSVTFKGGTRILFEFSAARPCGQFLDGTYWVKAPVTIQRMTPDFTEDGGGRNGWAMDPDPFQNSFDKRAAGYTKPERALPLTVANIQKPVSIIKADSRSGACNPSCLDSAAILTVVAEEPAPYSFRPPYAAGDKPVYALSQIDLKALPQLPALAAAPKTESVLENFAGPWIDLGLPQSSMQALRPRANYGGKIEAAQISNIVASAALLALHDAPAEQRLKILIPVVQYGIDNYHLLKSGRVFLAQTNKNLGHKLPILIAGRMLQNGPMYYIGYTHLGFGAALMVGKKSQNYFQEDGHSFIGQNDEALFGATYGLTGGAFGGGGARGYETRLLHGCKKGPPDLRDPDGYRDGGAINDGIEQVPNESGAYVCGPMPTPASQRESGQAYGNPVLEEVARPYVATATAARLWGLETAWNWPAFFRLAERWYGAPWNNLGRNANSYAEMMYGLYYAENPDGFVKKIAPPGSQQAAPIVWKSIPGLDDTKPLPGPEGLMRQILDIMYNGGSIRDLGEFLPVAE